jgi:hypothetical protein
MQWTYKKHPQSYKWWLLLDGEAIRPVRSEEIAKAYCDEFNAKIKAREEKEREAQDSQGTDK